ncbi:MAG TPA: hypothetical protein VL400_08545, partial [Polyangiaceae bacterium]|nr:hypothetical protein [Polyangiaceae bacterium]
PSSKALRLAIKARDEAGQASRAATLAALALDRYPDDGETKQLAEDAIAKLGKGLYRVEVSCASPCLLASGSHIVHGEAATRRVVYVDPGSTTLGASFVGNITAPEQTLSATAGGSTSIRFAPAKDGGVGASGAGGAGAGGASAGGASAGGASSGGGPTEGPGDAGDGGDMADAPKGDGDWRISPVPFFIGLAVTAGLGGTTIWSGVDTLNNPGTDAVKKACAGKGEDCPLYQDGQANELRTNILIGATAGAAAVTVIFAIVADWDGDPEPADKAGEDNTAVRLSPPRLWVSAGGANSGPDQGSGFGATLEGRF